MPIHPTFIDPYITDKKVLCQRCSIWLSHEDWQFLGRLDPNNPHFRQTTISILFKRLITELQKYGITQYDPIGAKDTIGRLTLTLGATQPGGPIINSNATKTSDRDDRRGTDKMAQSSSNPPAINANASIAPISKATEKRTINKPTKTK